jgi:hypothetical protein
METGPVVPEFVAGVLGLLSGGLLLTTIGFATAWIRARERALRNLRAAPADPQSTERLQRIELAVETTAVEVERLAEASRFQTKLLTARTAGADARAPLRTVTPH